MNRFHMCRWVAPTELWLKINFDAKAFSAEAMACLQAISLRLHLGLKKVEIEGDSQTVIQKLQERSEDRSEIRVFKKDSKYLSLGYESCVFHFIPREANKVAHLITKDGLQKRETTYLLNMINTGVEGVLDEDRRWTDLSWD